jgi:hypothetical protein
MSLSFTGDIAAGIAGNGGVSGSPNYGYATVWTNNLSPQPSRTQLSTTRSAVGGVSAEGHVVAWSSVVFVPVPPFQGFWIDARAHVWNAATNTSAQIAPLQGQEPGQPGFTFLSLHSPQILASDAGTLALTSRWRDDSLPDRAFCFTTDGALEQLPAINIPSSVAGPNRFAHAISADGMTIVGYAYDQSTSLAHTLPIRWTRDGTPSEPWRGTLLPGPTSAPSSLYGIPRIALDVSADGRVIVGARYQQFPYPGVIEQMRTSRAVLWINGRYRELAQLLQAENVDLGGAVPALITAISDDSSTLAGLALTSDQPDSQLVSFVATILPPGVCDDIDFNRDGNRFDPLDIDAFLSVFSEGPCLPAGASCRDIDFNNDGSLFDPEDVDAFLRVFSEGPCTL